MRILLLTFMMLSYKLDDMMEDEDFGVNPDEEEDFGSMADIDSKEFVDALMEQFKNVDKDMLS